MSDENLRKLKAITPMFRSVDDELKPRKKRQDGRCALCRKKVEVWVIYPGIGPVHHDCAVKRDRDMGLMG